MMRSTDDTNGRGQSPAPVERRRGPLRAMLDLFSSVWFGVVTLTLLFVYSSLGSAWPPFRQWWRLEMTEFEFFHWWPFDLLIALLVINVACVTVRRIRLSWINLGVWTIHTGIIILVLGSVYYFGTKIEGDAPIFRRRAVIRVPGQTEPIHMLILPGNHAVAGAGDQAYHLEIADIQPEYALPTEGHLGEKAYAVQISVRSPTQRFIRQVLAGYPQFTEDVIPGQGRAIKATGKALVDDALDIILEYEPQTHLFVMDTAALYVRPADSSGAWSERPIENLPHYHERVASRSEVWLADGENLPIRPIDLGVPAASDDGDALSDYDVRVTGYLRYALERGHWEPGGDRLNPVCRLTLQVADSPGQDFELAALDPQANHAAGGQLSFRWLSSMQEVNAAAESGAATLTVTVPEYDVRLEVPALRQPKDAPEQPFTPVEGTDYTFRVRNVVDNLAMNDRAVSVAIVEIKNGERSFTRMVADPPDQTRDMSTTGHKIIDTDDGIRMTYRPARPEQIILAAGPDPIGLQVIYHDGQGGVVRQPLDAGQAVQLVPGLDLNVLRLYLNARRDVRPEIVPLHRREREARNAFSMIKVDVARGGWSTSKWLPFNQYALSRSEYALSGRHGYQPRVLHLPDGRRVELLFSRERHELPNPVVLERFELETFQGGLLGSNNNVRDYISRLRFADGAGGWSDPVQMSSNRPASNAGYWFFQSTWDPPSRGSAGMNFTGAGIGNRNGVYIQLLGCCIAVAGMIYAFYVKPILIRRRRQAGRNRAATSAESEPRPSGRDAAVGARDLETAGQV
ncbi:MAG: hypothetical protein GY778_12840 [bacterium]|nr:hypothetical protein [bacterium]